jgi:hypothetical protein
VFPVSLYCLLCSVCLTSVSCVPDVSCVSRLSVVLCLSYFCQSTTYNLDTVETSGTQDKSLDNLETLDTSGTKDTEVRQTKHNIQSRDTGHIRNTRHRSKNDLSCVPDVSTVSRLYVVLCLSYFCVLCS